MKFTIIRADEVVGVDGVFRKMDLSDFPAGVLAVQFDTGSGRGEIEYDDSTTVPAEVRDYAVEDAAWAAARASMPEGMSESDIKIPAMTKKVLVGRHTAKITDLSPYRVFLDRWTALTPLPPVPPTPEEVIRTEIASIEAANPVAQRALRELILALGAMYPQAQTTVFYKKVVAVEALIVPLRDQL